jgi:DNA-binding transcriptional MerR regulator
LEENLHPDFLASQPGQDAIRSAKELPEKMYFRIGEVSRLTGLKPHVLRFWESEFPAIAPKKMGSNHRMFRRKDVELILEIKHLLYERRFTIEGARKHLETKPKPSSTKGPKKVRAMVSNQPMPTVQAGLFVVDAPARSNPLPGKIREELAAIRDLLLS